ncbi:MAG: hypothetical protein DBX46_02305 [Clostridiales bacterium]|nr:MAG: hypothetical protein DBX46_02305 [Clostridiales bacterium]
MYIADLHIHSKYSRATSRDCDAPHLELWARKKGIGLVGTGDFTHPAWRQELAEVLEPAEDGFYTLKEKYRLPCDTSGSSAVRFVVTGEISSIYKKNGKTRKVHNLIVLPGLEAAENLSRRLEAIGNIHSDGRPILGLDSRDLLEITLDTCPEALFIPAHIWTPHFSLFGAFSGFDTIEECFEDLTPHVYALETGLSSDPPMNWCISALDRYTLISNSDAHSPAKLGREANRFDTPLSYSGMARAIRTGEGFLGTIEFFPEEGKYHLDGHRNCHQRLLPEETNRLGGKCPVCGKKITIGVQHRAWELSDRPCGFMPDRAKPFENLVPLPELIAAAAGMSPTSKKIAQQYELLLSELGPEFYILREAPTEEIERCAGSLVAEGVRRLREGKVDRISGYDGEYGQIILFAPGEREQFMGQISMLGISEKKSTRRKSVQPAAKNHAPSPSPSAAEQFNDEQLLSVNAADLHTAVIAGPGTGKTKTLVERIAHLVENCGVKPSRITAVTFTNQAAAEMRERLIARLGGKSAVRGMTIGTFHSICLALLDKRPLLGPQDSALIVLNILRHYGSRMSVRDAISAVSRVKNGESYESAGIEPCICQEYMRRCAAMGARDLDDLLLDALHVNCKRKHMFDYLLVDEFQDINAVQRRLVRHWSEHGGSLFVIGDPDQSIYGFRGASAACFDELRRDFPDLQTIRLRKNYRSVPPILSCAADVIAHNPGGPRTLEPVRGQGSAVRLATADTPFSEAVWIAKEIARMTGGIDMLSAQSMRADRDESHSFSEIAVLCRTHRQLELIESCLRHDDIPCTVSGRGSYLEDDAVRGAVAFFRFLLHPDDMSAMRTCMQFTWDMSHEQIDYAMSFDSLRTALQEPVYPERWLAETDEFTALLQDGEKPRSLLSLWAERHTANDAMERLINTAVFYPDMESLLNALILGEEADIRRTSGKSYASGTVSLMTLHGAKGLEFPVVFLAGLSAGSLPLDRADGSVNTEEERRLLFVGMTRARDELIMTSSGDPSAFIRELPENVQKISAKTRKRRDAEQLGFF